MQSFGPKSNDSILFFNYSDDVMCSPVIGEKDTLFVTDSILQEVYITFEMEAKLNVFFSFFDEYYQNVSFGSADSIIIVSIFDPSIKLFSVSKKGITILDKSVEILVLDSSTISYRYLLLKDDLKYEEKYTVKASNYSFVKVYHNIFPCE